MTDLDTGVLLETVLKLGGKAVVLADHGNAEQMWDFVQNCPHTSHTLNLVECFVVGEGFTLERLALLVEKSDSEALEVFESLRDTTQKISSLEESKKLSDLLSGYQFVDALPLVKSLLQKMQALPVKGTVNV